MGGSVRTNCVVAGLLGAVCGRGFGATGFMELGSEMAVVGAFGLASGTSRDGVAVGGVFGMASDTSRGGVSVGRLVLLNLTGIAVVAWPL